MRAYNRSDIVYDYLVGGDPESFGYKPLDEFGVFAAKTVSDEYPALFGCGKHLLAHLIHKRFQRFLARDHLPDGDQLSGSVDEQHGLDIGDRTDKRRRLGHSAQSREMVEVVHRKIRADVIDEPARVFDEFVETDALASLFENVPHQQSLSYARVAAVDDLEFAAGIFLFEIGDDSDRVIVRTRKSRREHDIEYLSLLLQERLHILAQGRLVYHRSIGLGASLHPVVKFLRGELFLDAVEIFVVEHVMHRHYGKIFFVTLLGIIGSSFGQYIYHTYLRPDVRKWTFVRKYCFFNIIIDYRLRICIKSLYIFEQKLYNILHKNTLMYNIQRGDRKCPKTDG